MSDNNTNSGSTVRSGISAALFVLGVLLVAANLRAPITGVGPLIGEIRSQTGLPNTITGMLTALPLLAFAILSPLAPKIARRIGMEATLMLSMVVILIGIVVRSNPSVTTLFLGTLIVGLAIAIGNVLLPGLIKRDFPSQLGLMTGVYSVSMNGFGALASGISVPLSVAAGLGWRGSLASWAVLAGIAALCWLPQLRYRHVAEVPGVEGSVWRSALAWQVTLYMGVQAFIFYINLTWIPELLHDRGMSVATAGWMLSAFQFVGLPLAFLVPILAGRRPSQRWIVVVNVVFYLLGYIGLLGGNIALSWLWMVCLGIAGGSSFSLALTLFGLRANNARQAAELSGMAQCIGYLLAALGPIGFGLLHDLTHSWLFPLLLLVISSVLLLFVGLAAGRNALLSSTGQSR